MATPTERVTRNAHRFLADDHDVILALRVEWGPGVVEARKRFGSAFWAGAYMWTPIVRPIMAFIRGPKTWQRHHDPRCGVGILALTATDDRVLLRTSSLLRKTPAEIVEYLPPESPLEVDVEVMESDMVPALTVGHRDFVVNGVDFKALMKAVENREVRAPEIKAVLPRLRDVSKTHYTGVPTDFS